MCIIEPIKTKFIIFWKFPFSSSLIYIYIYTNFIKRNDFHIRFYSINSKTIGPILNIISPVELLSLSNTVVFFLNNWLFDILVDFIAGPAIFRQGRFKKKMFCFLCGPLEWIQMQLQTSRYFVISSDIKQTPSTFFNLKKLEIDKKVCHYTYILGIMLW